MQILMVSIIFAVLSFEFLSKLGWLPRILVYSPEVLAVVAAVLVIVAGIRSRFKYVPPIYWLVFGCLALIAICGVLANSVGSGPIFAGLRIYIRALPFFFLPAVLDLKERQLQVQLFILVAFGLLQLPTALMQRSATIASGSLTGDHTYGTLMNSATMSMFLVCVACVLTGFYLRKRISAVKYFPLVFLILVPTMVNETKAVVVLVPVALMTCFVVGAKPGARVKSMAIALVTVCCFFAVFIPVYDYLVKPRWGYGIVDFFTMEGRLEEYLDKRTEIGEYEQGAGKLGGLRIALSEISRDPVTLAFGLGIGNVSDSALGDQFSGKYYDLYEVFLTSSGVYIIFEFGLSGIGLVLLLYWLLFKDSVSVARDDEGMMGALAIGWSGVLTVFLIGTFYHNMIDSRALSILFWYISGLIVAYRMQSASVASKLSLDSVRPARFGPHGKTDASV